MSDEVDLYDLLDALIERVPWRTEAEMKQFKELVQKHREINLFGYMAQKITTERLHHNAVPQTYYGGRPV